MIKLRRPAEPPILGQRAADETTALRSEVHRTSRPPEDRSFKRSVDAHPTVFAALAQAQHGKCAFCETRKMPGPPRAERRAYLDVEHFRPKGAVQSDRNQPSVRPGYYWLAYSWTNLLLACSDCNSKHKGNLFPLARGSARWTRPEDGCDERALFVDPYEDEPSDWIRFRQHMPYAPSDNERGRRSIDLIGLNRRPLNDARREHLELIRSVIHVLRAAREPSLVTRARAVLLRAAQASSPYSAMVRDVLVAEAKLVAST